jgi:hypothetical protein
MLRLLGAVASIFCFAGCGGYSVGVIGSGTKTSELRQLEPFTRIEIRGAANADVVVGQPQSVTVEADDNILPIIETYVRGDTLVISNKDNYRPKTPVMVRVVVPELAGASVSGSGTVRATGIKTSAFAIDIRGSGNVTTQGTADSISIDLSGSGNIDASQFAARQADVNLSGSGNVNLCADDSLRVKLAGSGNVEYKGKPRVNAHVSGSGNVRSM